MADLLAYLPSALETCLDTVLYVGAGEVEEGALAAWQTAGAGKLLLVEGDADLAASLQRRCAQHAGIKVMEAAVSADGGRIDWHRYSLSYLNGPVDQHSLSQIYPRLRRLDRQQIESQRLGDLLDRETEVPPLDGSVTHALLLDVPGQEDALLGSLSPDQLRRFGTVIVRSARGVEEHTPANSAGEALLAAGFSLASQDRVAHPLWHVSVYRFDIVRHRIAVLSDALEQAEAREKGVQRQLQNAQDDLAQARQQAQSAELALHHTAQAMAEAETREAGSNARIQELERELAAKDAAQEQSRRRLDSEHRVLAQTQSELDALRQEHVRLRDELHREAAQAQELRQQLADQASRMERVDAERNELRRQLELTRAQQRALRGELEAADVAGWRQRCHDLERELKAQREENTAFGQRLQQLQEELLKAEGQLDMIKSLLLAGQGL